MNYTNIIWDLDGTIIDSKKGVFNSLQYALKQLNYPNIPVVLPDEFVGPPLQNGFKNIFGFNDKQTKLAIEHFRDYYGKAGIYECELYPGISELFENLHDAGHKQFVATSKLEKYSRMILEHLELDKYLDDLIGADYNGNHTKAELIQNIINKYRIDLEDVVMIGDTHFDIEGAAECEIDSIAVGYGFGEKDSLLSLSPSHYCDTIDDLNELLLGFY